MTMPDLTVRPYRLPLLPDVQASSSASTTVQLHKSTFGYPTRPIGPVTYTFSPVSSPGTSIMALVPPTNADDRQTYYISTTLNVFMPMSYITAVYKGEGELSEKVGEFEMGMSTSPASVDIQRSREPLKSVIARSRGGRTDGVWHWTPRNAPEKHLEWDYSKGTLIARCFARKSRRLLATYKYSHHIVPLPSRVHELEVTPDGHGFFEHLLLSLLVIERKRLTPRQSVLSKLWNF